jgi:DNA polymerase-1
MDTLVLIDGANHWYRAYSVGTLHMDAPGGPVLIMSYMVRAACKRFGKRNVIVCWDAGHSGRRELDKEYKGKRKSSPAVWEDVVYMYKMLDCLGVATAFKDGYEADDVIGSIAMQSKQPILINSYDKDFYQLVCDEIKVFHPERTVYGKTQPEKIIDFDTVIEEFGCHPAKIVLYKAFRGDTSDNIPKLPIRFTKKFKESFYKVLYISSSVESFYKHIDTFDVKYRDELLRFKDRAILNEKLIAIKTNLDVEIEKSKLNANEFELLCEELEIKRMKIADWEAIPEEPLPPPPVQGSLF